MPQNSITPFDPNSELFKKQTEKILVDTEKIVDWNKFAGEFANDKSEAKLIKREIVEDAKIIPTEDHSEIKLNIGLLRGKVIINFGKLPITWIELTKEQALEVAKIINEKANILKPI